MDFLKKLNREAWVLLGVSGLHAFSFALSNAFVNVFLWKINHDLFKIAWYNLANYFAIGVTFILAGWITKRVDRVISIRIGVALQALFYLTVLLLDTKAIDYVISLGFFLGLGSGFFWMSYNVLYFEISERDNRDVMNGISGFITSLSGMIAPLISGFIITRVDHFLGYRIIFGISLGIFALSVVVSFWLKLRKAEGRFRLREVMVISFRPNTNWFWVQLSSFFQGLREGVFLFFTGLLVYFITKNELTLGTYYTGASIVSLISYLLLGKYLRPAWRVNSVLVASVMMGLMIIPFLIYWNTWTVMLYGIGLYLFYPFYYAPTISIAYDVIGAHEKAVELRVEYVVAREIVMNFGRLISLIIFMIILAKTNTIASLKPLLLFLSFIQVGTWLSIRKVPLIAKL
ncbi:MFS transporter [Shimazuella sp. AN120528]|uniref:MFS transporter n=1 Tax=Shimazuella soli TaxID=1892854 RepID=UPI001F0F368A|nr:MFS transporter [Shimazuella soli]MCH5583620.1 MFS transporter [Shimazuella soli]